jgi:tRNA modification GTPase
MNDTIAAVSTAYGEGGIGIIRISGGLSIEILDRLFFSARSPRKGAPRFADRQMRYGHIKDPQTGQSIDEALVVFMKGPRTYTGEDVVEIQCHGSVVSLRRILGLCLAYGARAAEPGEFTKRAFLNGRLDLSQAEAVIDVVRAHTDAEYRNAAAQLSGVLSGKVEVLRDILSDALALLIVNLDYPDEDEDPADDASATAEITKLLNKAKEKLHELLDTAKTGRMIREGLAVVILGKPNVGKSSVLNRIMGEDRVLVSDIAGTTRDSIESYVDMAGIPVRLIDTAGIRESKDSLESLGVARAKKAQAQADLSLFVVDAAAALEKEDEKIAALLAPEKTIVLRNKSDLKQVVLEADIDGLLPGVQQISFSAKKGSGLTELEELVRDFVFEGRAVQRDSLLVTNARHEALIESALNYAESAEESLATGGMLDFAEMDIRESYDLLGEIIGERVDDQILEKVFSRFCVGK